MRWKNCGIKSCRTEELWDGRIVEWKNCGIGIIEEWKNCGMEDLCDVELWDEELWGLELWD